MGGAPEISPGVLKGYLPKEAVPDSAALLPPPPAMGSAAEALDQEIARENLTLRGTARWKLASMDADLVFPQPPAISPARSERRSPSRIRRGSM